MAELSTVHDKQDDIPEQYRELYTEKGGKWELTGIKGLKTEADVERLNTSLKKEREEHKKTKAALGVWGELKHDEVLAQLDKLPELEAAAKGALDEAKIEEIVARRVEGTLKSKLSPLERENAALKKERETLLATNGELSAQSKRRLIQDEVRPALLKLGVIPEAHEDELEVAERVFEVTEDGKVVTREGLRGGVPAGLDPLAWLTDRVDKKPHLLPPSVGGGARGSGSGGGGGGGKANPWSEAGWNLTAQGQYLREHGREKADKMAQLAGTTVGGPKPRPKKAPAAG